MSDSSRQALETFVKRGGGIVSLHDSLCGPDPAYSQPWWVARKSMAK